MGLKHEYYSIIVGTPKWENAERVYAPVYWAWANLAGIGNVESVPEGTIGCIVSLAVHLVGANLYAMAMGNIVSMLEVSATCESEVAITIASTSACIPSSERVWDVEAGFCHW